MDETNPPHVPTDATSCTASKNAMDSQDLRPFADQLMAIAQQLRDGAFASVPAATSAIDRERSGNSESEAKSSREMSEHRLKYVEMARQAYAIRRLRGTIFGNPELFGEPAWDILLDLYVARAEGKPVSVSSACIGSAAPATTGLRWLGVLAENDLILREHDPADQRRVLVRLTDKGRQAMDTYFASAAQRAVDA